MYIALSRNKTSPRSNASREHRNTLGHTDVSLNTLAEVPFCRICIYFVVSTSDILTCVLGTMTSVAMGN